MGKDLKVPDIIAKLQGPRGYKGWRIRPHWSKPDLWIAESTLFSDAVIKKVGVYFVMRKSATGPSVPLNWRMQH